MGTPAFLDATGGAVGAGRIAYAAAYLINTTVRPLEVVMTIQTNNQVEVQAGDGRGQIGPGGGDASVVFEVPPYSETKESARVLIKIFEAEGDGGMVFRALLEEDGAGPIDDAGDLIIRLDSTGGF